MKAAAFRQQNEMEIIDAPKPHPEAGEVVLKVHNCGICGSDLHAVQYGVGMPPGTVMGHEFCGEIHELGPGVAGFKLGDRVTSLPFISCGECEACRRDDGMHCASTRGLGLGQLPGAYAEFVLCGERSLLKLPGNVDSRAGALVEPLSVGLHGVNRAKLTPGAGVVVMGAGPIGLSTLIWAKARGAGAVVVSELAPGRTELAMKLGANAVVNPSRENPADKVRELTGRAPDVVFEVHATSDGAHLVITSHRGASDNAEVRVMSIGSGASRTLADGFSNAWQFIDGAGDLLYFRTDLDAPLGRIVAFNLSDATPAPWEVIPESADKLSMAAIGGGRFIVSYLERASDHLRIFELDGRRVGDLELPEIGTIVGIAARWHDKRSYVTFTSFTTPPRILECDVAAGRVNPIADDKSDAIVGPPAFDPAQYATEQVWFTSKDGTPVSMFLVQRLGSTRPASVLLTGYGGFNISLTPSFDPSDFLWLDAGGIIAVANLRGGGEYGDAWHRAGMLDRKQNVFDDFMAAAEWLTAGGHAAPGAIAIEGGSNGGLLVGAVMTQRPDLFGAVVCRVPVADMLRYHLFTVGRFWIPEYGSADDPRQFICCDTAAHTSATASTIPRR